MLRTRGGALVTVLAGFLSAALAAAGDLREAADPGLQARLEQVVAAQGLARPVSSQHLALALVDLSSPARPRLAMLNGDSMLYAASLPKIAILLGAFVEAERGRLPLDPPHVQALTQMVRYSSNAAASQVLGWVGEHRLIDILESPRFAFYDPAGAGGLWVGKSYGPSPAYLRDPVAGLSHGATAFQVARFYCMLDSGALVAPDLTRQMKEVLSRPGIHHKFVKGLEGRPGVTIYRKSGTWRDFHSDSALVEAGAHKYVLVGIAHDPRGGEWLERLAAPLHDVIVGSVTASR
ncbi:MAG TPA: serine hydrolase [Vicinamibacteria bacterium]|nr:serine hydrolase [Vicinamibacteria bacterium]